MENYLTSITNYLWTQSWQIAVLAVTIAAVSLLLKNKSAHTRYLLWLILLAKCLVPPLLTIPLAILPQEQIAQPIIETAAKIPALIVDTAETTVYERVTLPSAPVESTIFDKFAIVTLSQWFGSAWILGVVIFVLIAGIKAIRLNHWLKRVRKPLVADLQRGIRDLFAELNEEKFPKVWLVDGIGQPFVWGLLRGGIYLPSDFAEIKDEEHRRGILSHELSHILRFDATVNLLQIIAQAIFWFHPFVWWVNKKIRAEREKCCDEIAIAWLGTKARDFSIAIVNILTTEHKSTQPIPSLAVAGPVKNIEDRIKTIMNPGKKFYKSPSILAAIIILLSALVTVPTTLALTSRSAKKTDVQVEGKGIDVAFQELITAVQKNDAEKLQRIANTQADVYNFSDARKQGAFNSLLLDAEALRTYKGIEDLEMFTIKEQNNLTNVLTSKVADARGVTGRLSFSFSGKDKPLIETIHFIEDTGRKLTLRPQVLTSGYILTVPADLPQLKEIISEDKSKTRMITPEKLEEFLKVIRVIPEARMISTLKMLTNDGEVGEIRTENVKDLESIKLNIKNAVQPDRKTITLDLDFEYTCDEAEDQTITHVSAKATVLSEHAILLSGEYRNEQILLVLVEPKILEAKQGPKVFTNEINPKVQVDGEQANDKAKIQIDSRFLLVPTDASEINDFLEREKIAFPSDKHDPNYTSELDDEQLVRLLKLVHTVKGSQLLTTPKIIVFDGEEATLSIQREIVYTSGYSKSNEPLDQPQPKQDSAKIGTLFTVKPILRNENIYLYIHYEVSNITRYEKHMYKEKYPYEIPVIQKVATATHTLFPLGQTILLGGQKLTQREKKDGQVVDVNLLVLIKAEKVDVSEDKGR